MREFAKSQKNMAKVKRGNLQWFDINHFALHANFPMPSVNRFGIYANPLSLFAKLTKLQSLNVKPLDKCF